jgi:hypothetical protein
MRNLQTIKSIKDLTEEERSLHLHYTAEFLEENIKELYEVLSDDISSVRRIHHLAFLTDMNYRLETMLDK